MKKKCKSCGKMGDFWISPLAADGLQSHCKKCHKIKQRKRAEKFKKKGLCQVCGIKPTQIGSYGCLTCVIKNKWYGSHIAGKRFKKKFVGISMSIDDFVAWYLDRLARLNGHCEWCKEKCENLVCDHDHETGEPRALVCTLCNHAEGLGLSRLEKVAKVMQSWQKRGAPKRILLDVDGPLTDSFTGQVCALLRENGITAEQNEIDDWDIFKTFNVSKELEDQVRDRLCQYGIASSFVPRSGAVDLVKWLRTWAHVFIITAPLDNSLTWARERELWINKYFGIETADIIHARNKHIIAGDILIDDRVSTLEKWSTENPTGVPILWQEPHNFDYPWSGEKVNNHEELKELLIKLGEKQNELV